MAFSCFLDFDALRFRSKLRRDSPFAALGRGRPNIGKKVAPNLPSSILRGREDEWAPVPVELPVFVFSQLREVCTERYGFSLVEHDFLGTDHRFTSGSQVRCSREGLVQSAAMPYRPVAPLDASGTAQSE